MTRPHGGDYATTTLAPDWDEWPSAWSANRRLGPQPVAGLRADDLLRLRQRIVRAAREFTQHLKRTADQRGIATPDSCGPAVSSDTTVISDPALVMTGHQPTVLHPGIVYKYQVTEHFANVHSATAISILMDTDHGDAGEFAVPDPTQHVEQGRWPVRDVRRETLSHAGDTTTYTYASHRVRPENELSDIAQRVTRDLKQSQCPSAADYFRGRIQNYRKLAGVSAVVANSITRRADGLGNRLVELPLSDLCRFPEVQQFFATLLNDSRTFHDVYNESLEAWRKHRNIRNLANPFPNLGHRENRIELPFWLVDRMSNQRLEVLSQATNSGTQLFAGDQQVADNLQRQFLSGQSADESFLVPRGALITVMFRLLCCDIFVHGLGGQTYDQYTDQLIRDYFRVEPPMYAVASASQFLFESQKQRLDQLLFLASRQRDLAHHPESFFKQGWFSDSLERELATLVERKHDLVAALREKKQQSVSAADEGRELERLQREMKSRVASEFREPLAELEGLANLARDAINCRTYPWFYFPWDSKAKGDLRGRNHGSHE